ncbi:MAG: hypothetical protein LIP03_05840 [Bacteroidales bacterium]|nr:hypothetical protein [Bacteroidales bacterium]
MAQDYKSLLEEALKAAAYFQKRGRDIPEDIAADIENYRKAWLAQQIGPALRDSLMAFFQNHDEPMSLLLAYEPGKGIKVGIPQGDIAIQSFFEIPIESKGKEKKKEEDKKRSYSPDSTTRLIATFDDGTVYDDIFGTVVIVKCIEKIGIDRSRNALNNLGYNRMGIPYIVDVKPKDREKFYHPLSNGSFLLVNNSNERKKNIIEQVGRHCGVGVKCQVIPRHGNGGNQEEES